MKKEMLAILTVVGVAMMIPGLSRGHEGHSHAPSDAHAPNGGELRGTKGLQLELVKIGDEIKIYFHAKDLKSVIAPDKVKIEEFKVSGTNRKSLDRAGKFEIIGDHLKVTFTKDNSYKYDISATVTLEGKKQDKVKWQLEL